MSDAERKQRTDPEETSSSVENPTAIYPFAFHPTEAPQRVHGQTRPTEKVLAFAWFPFPFLCLCSAFALALALGPLFVVDVPCQSDRVRVDSPRKQHKKPETLPLPRSHINPPPRTPLLARTLLSCDFPLAWPFV